MANQARGQSNTMPHYLRLGEILRPHGVRGEIRIRILTDYPERINNLNQVFLGQDPYNAKAMAYTVQHMRMHKEYGLLKLKGVDSRGQAERLRQLFVMVDIDNAVPLEDDEVYLFQLIGLDVQTGDGKNLGRLTDVLDTGANDVYIVNGGPYGEILIPITAETLLDTDIEKGVITVTLPEGLLPS